MKAVLTALIILLNSQGAAASSLLGEVDSNKAINDFLSKYADGPKPAAEVPVDTGNPDTEPFVDVNVGVNTEVVTGAKIEPEAVVPVIPVPKPRPCTDPNDKSQFCLDLRARQKRDADRAAAAAAAADELKKQQDAQKAADAARRREAAAAEAEAAARRKKYPQCAKGINKRNYQNSTTTDYATFRDMADDILGFDSTNRSLVQKAHGDIEAGDRSQYWLQNSGGAAQLRLMSTFGGHSTNAVEVLVAAHGCQLNNNSVMLYGCGSVLIFTQCGFTVLTKKSKTEIRVTSPDDNDLNEIYTITSKSAIAR